MAKDDSPNNTADLSKQLQKRPHKMYESGTGNKANSNSETLMARRGGSIKDAPMRPAAR